MRIHQNYQICLGNVKEPSSNCLIWGFCVAHWPSQVALVVQKPPANAGNIRDVGSIPGLGRSPGSEHDNPLQYSCLEHPTDRGAWWATVHGITKDQTKLKQFSMPPWITVNP